METIVVKSRVKEVVKNCKVSSDFADALSQVAVDMIKAASKRADANGRKTIQAKDVYNGKKSAKVMLVSKAKAKDAAPKNNNMSGDFAEALNEVLVGMVAEAEARAEANGRKTIQARDL